MAVVLAASACSSGSDGKPAAASAKPVAATTAAPADPSSAPATTAAPSPTDLPTTAVPSATPSESSASKSASAKPSTSKPTSAKPSTSKPATTKPPAKPAGNLDPRCMTGRAMCVDKTTRKLTWVVDGVPQYSFEVRFGSAELPTREGAFSVFQKSRDHVSTLYHTSMPFAMFFSGGQAVHYSPDFAKNGYNGASHGCVNVRNKALITQLFDTVRIGDKVIVYRS
ncbi:L,D-transpeptidase [Uniformispora flossi]|uniref:L,D-transpeptidase n=1 Tax=Uniformispora flossi TaxID=3390723 RepID=UPI003C2EDC1E